MQDRSRMLQKLPPLGWLRAFEASARHLSFTRAADELHLTQAAVSKQIKLLEQHLKEPLFHRKPRSLVLTRVGAAYLPKVRDAFDRLSAGTEEVFGTSGGELLTLRAPLGYSVNWLGPRLHRFFDRHPDIDLRIVSSIWSEELDRERFDLDVRYGSGHWPGYRADRVSYETLEPLCAPSLAEGDCGLKSPQDLVHHKLLHVLGYEEGWGRWLQEAEVEGIDAGKGLHFGTSVMAFQIAAFGGGVALGRASMVEHGVTQGRLVRPCDHPVAVSEAFYLLAPEDRRIHPHAVLFQAGLLEEVANDPTIQRNKEICEKLDT